MKKLVTMMALTLAFSTVAATGAFAEQAANTTIGSVTKETMFVDLEEDATLYDSVGGKKVGLLGPQVIYVEASSKDENNITWYRVFTWMGTVWMKNPNADAKLVALSSNTPIYSSPNGTQVGNLGAQTAPVINEQIDTSGSIWYQINSYKGKSWVRNPEQSQRVKLNKATTLYQSVNGKKAGELNPQTVSVHAVKYDEKGQRWANILTWKGNLWMKW